MTPITLRNFPGTLKRALKIEIYDGIRVFSVEFVENLIQMND